MMKTATSWTRRGVLAVGAAALAAVGMAPDVRAEYPEKPIEMTVLFGSTAKTIAQLLANEMSKHLGQTVVPVDRPGGGGAVGYTHVHGAGNDGYNIVWNSNSITTAHVRGNMALSYKDFVPIARISIESPVVAVRADSGWKSLNDLKEAFKDKKMRVGTSGFGSFTHVVASAVMQDLGIDAIYVPYDAGKAPTELLAGRIDCAVQFPGQFISHVKSGDIRLIAVTGPERVSQIKDVPTAKEQGVGVELAMWRGLAAPAGTPPEAIKKLEEAAKKAAESPQFKEALQKLGAEVSFLPANEFEKLIVSDHERIAKVMADIGLAKDAKK